ncbi:MAG: segregation/condensation protein A [Candidatus Riflebacteria bacterium]|nr:segregation/condensation protein A [Candidatus Riflebacteria bacterium]
MPAYQVKLPAFEGPFDLLFHLIEEQKINIYDIPIALITSQYLDFLHMMEILDMNVASEFLVMAATLLEIKSKMLLPKVPSSNPLDEGDENFEIREGEDAREDLVAKLLEYRKFKMLAFQLRELEKNSSRIFTRAMNYEHQPLEILQISVTVNDLLNLYHGLVKRRINPPLHRVIIDQVSLTQKIMEIRSYLKSFKGEVEFSKLLQSKDRYEVVLSFMAILELAKTGEFNLVQTGNFHPIILRKNSKEAQNEIFAQ